jgi:hypothetical protein
MGHGTFASLALIFVSTAFAQIDSAGMRAKFGSPLNREVFTVRPGIEMIVDYSPTANHACVLRFPGEAMPPDPKPGVGINPKKIIDELVLEIVPSTMRGKELGRMRQQSGMQGMSSTDYENVLITEPMTGDQRTAVVVRFKTADCAAER